MSYILPSMGLLGISIGLDTGLTIETNTNSNWAAVDTHDHSSGKGIRVQPNGLNINTDLPFNSNNATLLRSANFVSQPSPLSAPTDLGCVYVSGVDLWYNDENGNQIQLTAGGSVNATSSGISDGTATASFVSGVLVVDSDVNTPANIQAGSLFLGNDVANSHFVELSPPAALTSDYQLVFPSIPASTAFVTLDTSGNFGTASNISGAQIAANSITGSQLAAATVTSSKIAASTILQSNMHILNPTATVNSAFTTTGTQIVPGWSTVITTSGGAVQLMFLSGQISLQCLSPFTVNGSMLFQILRNGSTVTSTTWTPGLSTGAFSIPCGGFNFVDAVTAGTHTYTVRVICGSQTQVSMLASSTELMAFEL